MDMQVYPGNHLAGFHYALWHGALLVANEYISERVNADHVSTIQGRVPREIATAFTTCYAVPQPMARPPAEGLDLADAFRKSISAVLSSPPLRLR